MNIYSSVIYGNKPNVYQLVNKYTDCGISLNRIVFNNKKEQNTNTFYDMLLLLLLSRFSCVRLSATPETACFWHFVGQRALEHLLGWEREGYANCTLVAAEAAKKRGGHLTAL